MARDVFKGLGLVWFGMVMFLAGCGSSSDDGMKPTVYESGLRSDSRLESLGFSTPVVLNPAFDPDTFSYETTVYRTVGEIALTPKLSDRFAEVTVNGRNVEEGAETEPISLALGQTTTITIRVTAENGGTRDYMLAVYRSDKNTITSLAHVGVEGFSLVPKFEENPDGPWDVAVPSDQANITVTATATDELARQVTINGVAFAGHTGTVENIGLTPGATRAVVITVDAQEDGISKSYVIKAARAGGEVDSGGDDPGGEDPVEELSRNVDLSSLTLRYGYTTLALTPDAGQATPVTVPWDCSRVTVAAKAVEAPVVTVNGGASPASVEVYRHQSNTVTIHVVAEDGTGADYVLAVERAISQETGLANFGVSSGRHTMASWFSVDQDGPWYCLLRYDEETYSFSAETKDGLAQITSATMNGNTIPIRYGGSETLSIDGGDIHDITFTVTAEDAVTSQTYELRVYRHNSSLNISGNLDDLEVYYSDNANGRVDLLSGFSASTFSYGIQGEIPNGVSSVTVLPHEINSAQLISVNGYATAGTNWPNDAAGQVPVDIPILPGPNTITVYSQSPNGADNLDINTREYVVTLTRAYAGNADLAHLTILGLTNALDLDSPSGDLGSMTMEEGNQTLTLTATAQDPHVTGITVTAENGNGDVATSDLPNGLPVDLTLSSGQTVLLITVMADDGITSRAYTLSVSTPLSDDTSISRISTTDGIASGGGTDWRISIGQGVSQVGFSVVLGSDKAHLAVRDSGDNVIAPDSPGSNAYTVTVPAEDNTVFSLDVTAENGDVRRHTLTIKPPVPMDEEGTGRLSDIRVSMGSMFESPRPLNLDFTEPVMDGDESVFSPDIFTYDVLVYGFDTVKFRVKAQEGTGVASVTVNGIPADITGASPTQVFLYNGKGYVTPVEILVTDDNGDEVAYVVHVKLLNIYEFFRGIYAGLMNEVYDSKWDPKKPSGLGDDITIDGLVSGNLHWYTEPSNNGCIADSVMNLTQYNDGQFGVNHVNGGIVVVGETIGCFSAQKTGYITGGYRIYTPEGDFLSGLDYHLYSDEAEKVERDDAYTDCTYMGETVRMKYYHTSNVKSESPFNPVYYPDYDYYSYWVLE